MDGFVLEDVGIPVFWKWIFLFAGFVSSVLLMDFVIEIVEGYISMGWVSWLVSMLILFLVAVKIAPMIFKLIYDKVRK